MQFYDIKHSPLKIEKVEIARCKSAWQITDKENVMKKNIVLLALTALATSIACSAPTETFKQSANADAAPTVTSMPDAATVNTATERTTATATATATTTTLTTNGQVTVITQTVTVPVYIIHTVAVTNSGTGSATNTATGFNADAGATVAFSDAAPIIHADAALDAPAIVPDAFVGSDLRADVTLTMPDTQPPPRNDASPTLDTTPAHVDAFVALDAKPDGGAPDAVVVSNDALALSDTGSDADTDDAQAPTDATTSCQGFANGQTTIVQNGHTVACTYNGLMGTQQCLSGTMSACITGGSATTSGEHAVADCQLTGIGVGTLTLTGNVIGDLFDSGVINRICLVGDPFGSWAGNHNDCLDYNPDASFRYIFTNIPLPNADNRITFLGFQRADPDAGVTQGPERWDNNFVLLYAPTVGNKCRFKDAADKFVFSQ